MPVTDPNANTLFDRLPRTVFRPLAAANNTRYWDLLGRLVDEFWGDGARTPGEDVPKSELIAALESYLVVSDPWEAEDGAAPDTPANIRAHGIYSVFRDSGWLSQRKRGVRDMATIRPVLAQFHTLLREFGTKEPEFLGSEVRSVFLNLQEAAGGKGDAYAKAAREAKHCMTHLASTGVAVYDLMASLQSVASTREFVAGYFDDFIRRHFIGDYHELRTKAHPLQHRTAIVTLTLQIQHHPERRKDIVAWYQHNTAGGDADRAEAYFERDTRRLMRLETVEDELRRLDDEIRAANQRALAYLDYRLRAPRHFDKLIARAIAGVASLRDGDRALPAGTAGELAGEGWLGKARQVTREPDATRVQTRVPTLEELALQSLRKRMADARLVRPDKLAAYVARHLQRATPVFSDQLQIETVSDLCCYQRLLLIASRNEAPLAAARQDPFVQMLPAVRIQFVDGPRTLNPYVEHRRFVIQREKAA